MTQITVDDFFAERLKQIAQRENRPLDAVLRSMLESYAGTAEPSDWPLMMAQMAEADTDIVWNEYAPDLSARSREILEREFGDYLLKRLNHDADHSA
jgi:hypothetical protein